MFWGGEPDECRGLLVADPATDRLTVVARRTRHGDGTVWIADKRAAAGRFGRRHTIASAPVAQLGLFPASLTRLGGRVTLALRGVPPRGVADSPRAGLHVATGSSPAGTSRPRRVPRTGVRDTPAVAVAARSASSAVLARQRDSLDRPSWDQGQQGIWLRSLTRDRRTGAVRFGRPRHLRSSAYAELDGLATDARGRPVVAFRR